MASFQVEAHAPIFTSQVFDIFEKYFVSRLHQHAITLANFANEELLWESQRNLHTGFYEPIMLPKIPGIQTIVKEFELSKDSCGFLTGYDNGYKTVLTLTYTKHQFATEVSEVLKWL